MYVDCVLFAHGQYVIRTQMDWTVAVQRRHGSYECGSTHTVCTHVHAYVCVCVCAHVCVSHKGCVRERWCVTYVHICVRM
jgi:hypothetical protein